jgi:hypothetical protein
MEYARAVPFFSRSDLDSGTRACCRARAAGGRHSRPSRHACAPNGSARSKPGAFTRVPARPLETYATANSGLTAERLRSALHRRVSPQWWLR